MSNGNIIKNDLGLDKLYEFIESNDKLAFDIETTGLNVRNDTIIGFGVSNGEEGYYVAHKSWDGSKLNKLVSAKACIDILNKLKAKKLIMFNGSFDTIFTYHYFGVDLSLSLWSDAMLAKHTCDEEPPFRLKDIAKKLYGADATEEQALMKESIKLNGGTAKQFFKADLDIMGKYCVQDCLLTYRINEYYMERMKVDGAGAFYSKNEVMPLYRELIIPMELNGVRVDVDLLRKSSEGIKKDIAKIEDQIQSEIKPLLGDFERWFLWKDYPPRRSGSFAQMIAVYSNMQFPSTATGKLSITKDTVKDQEDSIFKTFLQGGDYLPEDVVKEIQLEMLYADNKVCMFNISSKDHLKKLFFEKLGEEPVSRTPKGAPQVNDEFLDIMAGKYGWASKIRTFNRLRKLQGTYIDKYLEQQEDGVFYPSWFMHRTTSGRLAGDLQQMPRQIDDSDVSNVVAKYNNVIRDCIVAGEGRKLIGADYASLEVVVFADDAGDEALLDMIRKDEDFYSKMAIGVHGLEDQFSADKRAENFLKKHRPELRQDAKAFSLGIRYGLGAFKLSKTLNIGQKEAQDIIDLYFKTYPKLKKRMLELRQSATKNGFVKSVGGRVRHLPLLKSLEFSYGDILDDSLKIWKKYNEVPKKYEQVKYLGKQYRSMLNKCYNFPIQSMAATICNKACVAIARELKRLNLDAHICMQIHDEVVINCAEKDVEKVSKIVQYLMESTTRLSVPLKAEPEVGNKYGEIK